MGNLDWKVSALGFGCMRLPTKTILDKDSNNSKQVIDREYAIMVLIRASIILILPGLIMTVKAN